MPFLQNWCLFYSCTTQGRRAPGPTCLPAAPLQHGCLEQDSIKPAIPEGQPLLTSPSPKHVSVPTSSHTTGAFLSPVKMKFPFVTVALAPSILDIALPPRRAGWSGDRSMTEPLRCPECGQASLTPWRGILGRASFTRASIPPLMPGQQHCLGEHLPSAELRTASTLRNWGAHAMDRCQSLTPFPSSLNTRKLKALLHVLPMLSWQTQAPPVWLQVGFFLISPWQAPEDDWW